MREKEIEKRIKALEDQRDKPLEFWDQVIYGTLGGVIYGILGGIITSIFGF